MKIRVLKELPWAKVGEEFELDELNQWVFDSKDYRIRLGDECIISMSLTGWIKFIDEKKTLNEKLVQLRFEKGAYFTWEDVIEICRQHFLDALPKVNTPLSRETEYFQDGINHCKKIIQEAE